MKNVTYGSRSSCYDISEFKDVCRLLWVTLPARRCCEKWTIPEEDVNPWDRIFHAEGRRFKSSLLETQKQWLSWKMVGINASKVLEKPARKKKNDVKISLDRWAIRGWNVFLENPGIVSTEMPFRERVFHADCYKSWKDPMETWLGFF